MITRAILLSYCLFLFSLLYAQEPQSFCGWSGEDSRWAHNTTTWDCRILTYKVDLYCLPDNFVDGSVNVPVKITEAVSGAVSAWNSVGAGIRLLPTSCENPDIWITCADLDPDKAGNWTKPDVRINDDLAEWGYTTSLPCLDREPTENDRTIDLQFILTHELGHALGFTHEECCNGIMRSGDSHMAPTLNNDTCPDQRDLAQDDIDGMLATYPPLTIERETPIDCGDVERFSFPIEELGSACVNSLTWAVNAPYEILSGQGTSAIEVGIIECTDEPIRVRFMISSDCYSIGYRESFARDTDYCCDDIIVFGGALSSCCFGDVTNLAVSTADIVAMGCDPSEIDFEWNLPQGFIIHPSYNPNSSFIGVYMAFNCGACNPSAAVSVTMSAPCLEKPVTYTKSVVSCCEAPDPGAIEITPVYNRASDCVSLQLETENQVCDFIYWTVSSDGTVLGEPNRVVEGDLWDLECLSCDEPGQSYELTLQFTSDCGTTQRTITVVLDEDDCDGGVLRFGEELDNALSENHRDISPVETSLYPNPANDYVIVANPFMEDVNFLFEIFDLSGKLISDQIAYPFEAVDIAGLVPGMYLVRMTSFEYNSVIFEKLIVD